MQIDMPSSASAIADISLRGNLILQQFTCFYGCLSRTIFPLFISACLISHSFSRYCYFSCQIGIDCLTLQERQGLSDIPEGTTPNFIDK